MKQITLDDFERSDTAVRLALHNAVPEMLLPTARETLAMMESIQAYLSAEAGRDVQIFISSGYRCKALNQAVGSSKTSDHPRAMACDWTAPLFGTPREICVALEPVLDELGIGQLIFEFGRWCHTSSRPVSVAANRVLTINHAGISAGISAGIAQA